MARHRGRRVGGYAWSVPPSAFADLVQEQLALKVRKIALDMLNAIVLRSPVDTGRFKGNHIVSIGAPVFYSVNEYDKEGSETIARGVTALSGLEPFTVVYIQNNLIYAVPLENGHSGQAPAGIYGVSFYSVTATDKT